MPAGRPLRHEINDKPVFERAHRTADEFREMICRQFDVLYREGAESGRVMVDFYAPMKPTLEDKKIRAVATTGTQRSPFFTGVPTVAEAGVAGYEVTSWNGLFAPAGTPAEIINLLNKTIREIVATPEVKQRYAELGIEAKAGTPEELKARLAGDITKWAAVIERAGIPKQ